MNFKLVGDGTKIIHGNFTEDLSTLRAMASQNLLIERGVGN